MSHANLGPCFQIGNIEVVLDMNSRLIICEHSGCVDLRNYGMLQ